ncbi:hypothetical protein PORCAN_1319 [Porphyromonas crevioricanis JCM 13913]|nr:hypothetical protein PORCAN_1319 [Porphyromonas crevioricanis JCM 13913]
MIYTPIQGKDIAKTDVLRKDNDPKPKICYKKTRLSLCKFSTWQRKK